MWTICHLKINITHTGIPILIHAQVESFDFVSVIFGFCHALASFEFEYYLRQNEKSPVKKFHPWKCKNKIDVRFFDYFQKSNDEIKVQMHLIRKKPHTTTSCNFMLNSEAMKSYVAVPSLSVPFPINVIEKCIRMYERIAVGRHIFSPTPYSTTSVFFICGRQSEKKKSESQRKILYFFDFLVFP